MKQNIYLKLKLTESSSTICVYDILYVALFLSKYLKENFIFDKEYIETIYKFSINIDNYLRFEDDLLEYMKELVKELDISAEYYNEIVESFYNYIENDLEYISSEEDYDEDEEFTSYEIDKNSINKKIIKHKDEHYIINYEMLTFFYKNLLKSFFYTIKIDFQKDELPEIIELNISNITCAALYEDDFRFFSKSKEDKINQFVNDVKFLGWYNQLLFNVSKSIDIFETSINLQIPYCIFLNELK